MLIAATIALMGTGIGSIESLVDHAWQEVDKNFQKELDNDKVVGKKYCEQVEKQYKLSIDAEMTKRVQRIGSEIATIANATHATALWGDKRFAKFDYTFKVIQEPDPNAFSLPGGYIYVHEGLLKFADSDDEVAGVLAHEIAHAAFRHVAILQREAGKLEAIQIPLIIAAILTGGAALGPTAIISELAGTAFTNGWGQDAEKAADYGGFQFIVKSKYDPTGMLTFMERLQKRERMEGMQFLGIYRTHPPSRIRADSITGYMNEAHLPIRRSHVSPSYRATVKPGDDGTVEIMFGKMKLIAVAGNEALTRADDAVNKLNDFFDTVPEMFEVKVGDDGAVIGGRQKLFAVTHDDADKAKASVPALQAATIKNIRGALFTLAYRVWDGK